MKQKSKIDKVLRKKQFDETKNQKLINEKRKILVITSPPSKFIHIDSFFIDLIIKGKGFTKLQKI